MIALPLISIEPVHAAKQIAFSWSTTFTLSYEPGGSLKAGVNPSKLLVGKWVQENCTKRYGFLFAEVLGASGKVLGKSNPKLTKGSSISLKSGWRKNQFGESEYFLDTKCSGSMNIPVGGSSNYYVIRASYQLWNENNNFRTKDVIGSEISREYTVAELESNNWRVELVAGQTSLNRCCTDNSWGPAPKLKKLPDLQFNLVENRPFNEFEEYLYQNKGITLVYELSNFQELDSNFQEFYLELNPSKEIHGETPEEVFARYDSDGHRVLISIPLDSNSVSKNILKIEMGYRTQGFARWSYSLSNIYELKWSNRSLILKSKVENVRGYSL